MSEVRGQGLKVDAGLGSQAALCLYHRIQRRSQQVRGWRSEVGMVLTLESDGEGVRVVESQDSPVGTPLIRVEHQFRWKQEDRKRAGRRRGRRWEGRVISLSLPLYHPNLSPAPGPALLPFHWLLLHDDGSLVMI